jgi:hypothetical protein
LKSDVARKRWLINSLNHGTFTHHPFHNVEQWTRKEVCPLFERYLECHWKNLVLLAWNSSNPRGCCGSRTPSKVHGWRWVYSIQEINLKRNKENDHINAHFLTILSSNSCQSRSGPMAASSLSSHYALFCLVLPCPILPPSSMILSVTDLTDLLHCLPDFWISATRLSMTHQ